MTITIECTNEEADCMLHALRAFADGMHDKLTALDATTAEGAEVAKMLARRLRAVDKMAACLESALP